MIYKLTEIPNEDVDVECVEGRGDSDLYICGLLQLVVHEAGDVVTPHEPVNWGEVVLVVDNGDQE